MAGGFILAHSAVPLSYAFTEDSKYNYYKDHGFIKLPGVDYGYYSNSLWAIWSNPLNNPYSNGLDINALPEMVGALSNPSSYIPGTKIKDN
jgi:hypothetical protein